MDIAAKTYFAKGSVTVDGLTVTMNDVQILAGAANDTIVRSLTIINNDAADSVVYIKRADTFGSVYHTIKVFLPPSQSRVLWDDFIVIPEGHKLLMASDSDDTEVVVSCFDGVSTIPPETAGTLKVDITGAAAGQWSINGGVTWYDSGETITITADSYTVSFKDAAGYTTPVSQSATVAIGELTEKTAEYEAIPEPTETQGVLIVTITGSADGRWSVDSGVTWYRSGIGILLDAGGVTLSYKPVDGYAKPENQSVTIVAETAETATGDYIPDTAGLFSWGLNSSGELGLGDNTSRNTPTRVESASSWLKIAAGYVHTLAINTVGELYAWGENNYGQLGLGDTTDRNTPTRVGSASNWLKIAAGYGHTLAINTVGELYAWGENNYGYLGLGDTTGRNTPTRVGSATNWSSVAAARYSSFAINTSGELYACGKNLQFQLGLGDTTQRNTPTKVGSATNWDKVFCSENATFAINSSGELYAWGSNFNGEHGTGNYTPRSTPTKVGSASNWSSVAAGDSHTVAINTSGELYATGLNHNGKLGLGDTIHRNLFTRVGGFNNWMIIEAKKKSSFAINSSGELYAWGLNNYGQLGLGDTTARKVPVKVGSATDWASVVAGGGYTLAILDAIS